MDSSIESVEPDVGLYDFIRHHQQETENVVIDNMQLIKRDHRITASDMQRTWQRREPARNKQQHRNAKRASRQPGDELLEGFPRRPVQRPRRHSLSSGHSSLAKVMRAGVSNLKRELSGLVSDSAVALRRSRSRSMSSSACSTNERHKTRERGRKGDCRHQTSMRTCRPANTDMNTTHEASQEASRERAPPRVKTQRDGTVMVPERPRHGIARPFPTMGRSSSARYHYSSAPSHNYTNHCQSPHNRNPTSRRQSSQSRLFHALPQSPASARSLRVSAPRFPSFSSHRQHTSPTGVMSDIGGRSPKATYLDSLFEWASPRPLPVYQPHSASEKQQSFRQS